MGIHKSTVGKTCKAWLFPSRGALSGFQVCMRGRLADHYSFFKNKITSFPEGK